MHSMEHGTAEYLYLYIRHSQQQAPHPHPRTPGERRTAAYVLSYNQPVRYVLVTRRKHLLRGVSVLANGYGLPTRIQTIRRYSSR